MKDIAKRKEIDYTESDILLGVEIINKLKKVTEVLLYIKEHKNLKFSYILFHSTKENFLEYITEQKRDTDLAFHLSEKEDLYCLVCQETDIEGGYRFAERLMKSFNIDVDNSLDFYANILFVDSNKYDSMGVLFQLIDAFSEAKRQDPKWRKGQITYKTV